VAISVARCQASAPMGAPTAVESRADRSVAAVEQHSASLRKELGTADLVLTQVLYVVGATWVGAAAKLGSSQVVFWLLAIALFYLPQAAVVIHLNRRMPLEGGLYQWTKLCLGEQWGFLVAWNLWVYTLVLLSAFALSVATAFAYLFGARGADIIGSRAYNAIVTVVLILGMMMVSTLGLRVGKRVHNLGGLAQLLVFTALIAAPVVALVRGTVTEYHPLPLVVPAVSLLSLNILGKMGMGALSGFEWVAILAGESKHPAQSIARSVVIATPVIAVMFILGTSAVMTFVQGNSIDLVGPIPQTLRLGYASFGATAALAPLLIALMLIRQLAGANLVFTGTTRLPMVAGWDGLLPSWFTRLHPRYRTPVNSIIFAGALCLVLGLLSLVGVGRQESYQVLDNAAGVFYALTYVVMFMLPLLPLTRAGAGAPIWLRGAALSGLAMTLLYVALAAVPIVEVVNPWWFAAKLIVVVVVANLCGVLLYRAEQRRSAARLVAAMEGSEP